MQVIIDIPSDIIDTLHNAENLSNSQLCELLYAVTDAKPLNNDTDSGT